MFAGSTIRIAANGTTSDFLVRRFTTCDELSAELEERLGYGVQVRIQPDGRYYFYNPTTTAVTGISITALDPSGKPVDAFSRIFSSASGNLVPQGELKSESFWDDGRYLDLHNRLEDLDHGSETVLSYISQVGARSNRLTRTQEQNGTIIQNLSELKSNNDDVDIARTITELKSLETVLQAALGTGSQIIQPTLFDYL
jgi:flagellin-like hook-associated protein FlgL